MIPIKIKSDIDYYDERFLMFVLDQMAYEYEQEGKDVLRLTLGKSELPMHDSIIQEMHNTIDDYTKYSKVFPGGLPELKHELSLHYQQVYNLDISPDRFIISVGTSSIFRNLFHLLLDENDEVLLPKPYYSLYRFCAKLSKANIRYYNIDIDNQALDMQSFRDNFTEKTRVVVINNPGNPLGNVLSDAELHQMDEIVAGKAVIINDEIYANIWFDDPCKSVLQHQDTKSHFIVTNAFSKGYRMYSRRVGYCIVPEELVLPMNVIQHHTLLTLDPIVQYGAIAALKHTDEVEHLRLLYKSRRDYTMEKLKNVKGLRPILSKGSFYITLDCKGYMDEHSIYSSYDLAERIMKQKYVATVPGSDFGLDNTLRLSFSNKRYNEAIDRLFEFFSN